MKLTTKQARNHLWAIEEDIDHGNYLDKPSDEENSKQAKIALQMGADALEREMQTEAYREYLNKYCVNCQAYSECDLIPIDENKKIIEDFVNDTPVCSEWMAVEKSE